MKILLCGATGAMGRMVAETAAATKGVEVVCGWCERPSDDFAFPLISDLAEAPAEVDVIIDFSVHHTAPLLAEFAVLRGLPLVVATTGHTSEELGFFQKAAETVPVFYSGNMSLGVYVIKTLTKMAAAMLDEFDIEVVEAHHNLKTDAPSGTAKMLVAAAQEVRPRLRPCHGREGHTGRRHRDEIGVHAVRGGSIVGEHTVLFAGADECVEIKHIALSKKIFAKGALRAAAYVRRQGAGMYNMDDMMKEEELS